MEFTGWNLSLEEAYEHLRSRPGGLTQREAQARLGVWGRNTLSAPTRGRGIRLLLSQFKSPLILLLIFASTISFVLGAHVDATIILAIVLASGALGFFQERGAVSALEKLMQLVAVQARVRRGGVLGKIPIEEIVPGDVIELMAGDQIPGDCILVESNHLFVNEATLTGESLPVEKMPGAGTLDTPIFQRTNALFMASTVVSGNGLALVVATSWQTQFGQIARQIRFRPPETAFELGVRKFSYFLFQVTMVLVLVIFAVNLYLHRPMLDSFLFSVALAVGLTPQLLPAIISVNLSHGARRMALHKVVVKRLPSIENFGQMDVLCADKTGTITTGKVELARSIGLDGMKSPKIERFAALNAYFQKGYENPLDAAILSALSVESGWEKIDERPYDFIRKRLIVLLKRNNESLAIAKGAVQSILSICNRAEPSDGSIVALDLVRSNIEKIYEDESRQGYRLLGVAYRVEMAPDFEAEYVFLGFLRFDDPIKPGIAEIVSDLKKSGVRLKIITGDNRLVALEVASHIGLTHAHLATGSDLASTSDEALMFLVLEKNIFAEIEPNQKERIILALRKMGHIVGFLGDGINDVSALHMADVGIAVEGGAAAAKEAADIVLLEKDLTVLRAGIEEGRHTFTNTIKYVYMAASANFGNMFSMAGVSLFLPFLPFLPKQVLLTNLLTDFPEMAIASDHVDAEAVRRPLKWDLPLIRRFMVVFGLISSVFDFLTFGVLLYWMHASKEAFRTGWFIESVASATLVVLAIRTRRWIFQSRPGLWLMLAILAVIVSAGVLPYTTLGVLFGFVPLPLVYYAVVGGIVGLYIASVEAAKRFFF
ncbi:MAG: magnesium-translocating P-type ATPase [Parachlamydiales bacterium]|nr:magnesium-translocating P-type ATPase [Parachlamydiales bacterium]